MKSFIKISLVAGTCLVLMACGDSSDNDDDSPSFSQSYRVTVVNLSHNQPMSPVAVITHDEGFSAWSIGTPASSELEVLAEGGDNSGFITGLISAENAVSASGTEILVPGGIESITITADSEEQTRITLASMFVNTNDAFVGLNSVDVSDLAVGGSLSIIAPVFDAGTEADSEVAGTIPGPADGGTGYDASRDDQADRVSRHTGVVSSDDGLSTSVLDQSHRFDNPGIRVVITRL